MALDHSCVFELKSDKEMCILEIQAEKSKSMKDSAPSTVRSLLIEFEEAGIVDATINSHEVVRLSPMAEGA